jgi:hypothetical protein
LKDHGLEEEAAGRLSGGLTTGNGQKGIINVTSNYEGKFQKYFTVVFGLQHYDHIAGCWNAFLRLLPQPSHHFRPSYFHCFALNWGINKM